MAITEERVDLTAVLDLGSYLAGEPGALTEGAARPRAALEHVGFTFVVNHGIDRQRFTKRNYARQTGQSADQQAP